MRIVMRGPEPAESPWAPRRGTRLLGAGIISGLWLLAGIPAAADCVDPGGGGAIVCEGEDLDGFASADNGRILNVVEAAPLATPTEVSNGAGLSTLSLGGTGQTVTLERGTVVRNDAAGQSAIEVGDNSSVTLDAGLPDPMNPIAAARVEVTGANGTGILIGNDVTVTNNGDITVNANGGVGIRGGDLNVVRQNGTLNLGASEDAIGILLGNNINLNSRTQNTGELLGTGDRATGMRLGDSATGVNFGSIELDGNFSVAVELGDVAEVQNQGDIELAGDDAVGIRVGTGSVTAGGSVSNFARIVLDGARGIGIDAGDRNSVSNAPQGALGGLIQVTGDDAIGVRLGGAGSTLRELNNAGSIDASGQNAIGVRMGFGGGAGNTLTNSGTIHGGTGTGVAVTFEDAGTGMTNTLTNSGTIEVPDAAGLRRTAIRGGAGADAFTNRGSIIGHVELGAGDDLFTLETGATLDAESEVRGGASSDTFQLMVTSVPFFGDIEDGAFKLDTAVDFERLHVLDGTWTLTGTSNFAEGVAVMGGGVVVDELVMITNDYLQGDGTLLEVHFQPLQAGPLFNVGGTLTFEPDATLRVVQDAPILSPVAVEVLRAGVALAGFDPALVELPAQVAGLDFALAPSLDGLALVLSATRGSFAAAADTGNQRAVGTHLDNVIRAGGEPAGGDLATIVAALTLPAAQFAAAANTLHPEAYDAHTAASLSLGRLFAQSAMRTRPRCETTAYRYQPNIIQRTPCGENGVHVWADAVGEIARRDGSGGHLDYARNLGGLLVGADLALGEYALVSGYLGGAHAALDVDSVGDGSVSSVELGVAGLVAYGATQLRAALGYGHGFHKQDREIALGALTRAAKSDYGSDRVHVGLELAHLFRFDVYEVGPLAGLDYAHVVEESFDESGAQAASLEVDERSNDVLRARVGFRAGATWFKNRYVADWLEWANGVWRPEIEVSWRPTLTGAKRDLSARLSGAPAGAGRFEVGGEDAEQGVEFGARSSFQPYGYGLHLDLGIDYFLGDGSQEGRAHARIRVPF